MTEKFPRTRDGRYIHAETSVTIIQGESGRWLIYAPRPASAGLHLYSTRATLTQARVAATDIIGIVRRQRAADHATALDIEAEGERRAAKRALIADWQERVHRKATELASGVANMSDAWDAVLDDLHAEALAMNDPNEVIHFWTMDRLPTPCGVDIFTTPYTYGSDVLAEVTCPPCKALATPISVGTLDNGAAVDAIRRDWTDMRISGARATSRIKQATGVTTEGAITLLYADSVAALAG